MCWSTGKGLLGGSSNATEWARRWCGEGAGGADGSPESGGEHCQLMGKGGRAGDVEFEADAKVDEAMAMSPAASHFGAAECCSALFPA